MPNKSLQPTATAVTPPAAQEIAPAVAVAEHQTLGMNTSLNLSFVCPVPWQSMAASERGRFSHQCQRDIPNLSLLTSDQREALIERAKGESICAAFLTHLNGELATLETLSHRPFWRVVQRGIASAALGTLVVSGGCATLHREQSAGIGGHSNAVAQSAPSTPEDENIVLIAFGMMCAPSNPIQQSKPSGK